MTSNLATIDICIIYEQLWLLKLLGPHRMVIVRDGGTGTPIGSLSAGADMLRLYRLIATMNAKAPALYAC